jgi:hypothetical protein
MHSYDARISILRLITPRQSVASELPGINSFASAGARFVTVRNRTMLTLFNVDAFSDRAARVIVSEEDVQYSAVSETFHLPCAAMRDQRLHSFSLKSFHWLMVFKLLLSISTRIVILPTWDSPAGDFGREITFFSVNGQFLHDHLFASWTAVRSRNDFD